MPGVPELVVILLIVLVVFGANKLPSIGDALGRSIKNFKRASKTAEGDDDDDKLETKDAKQLAPGKNQNQLEAATEPAATDAEWEEVVVRRRKKPAASES